MISERQIRNLLKECEVYLGCKLENIRSRLLSNHDYSATIWELVILYSSMDLGARVEHEPGRAMPDLKLSDQDEVLFWLEVLEVGSATKKQSKRIGDLHDWIYNQLRESGCQLNGGIIDISPIEPKNELSIPPFNEWKSLKKSASWKSFVSDVRSSGVGRWDFCSGNACISFSANQSECLTASYLVPNLPKYVKQHPVYKAIKRKGKQIKKWDSSITDRPIVLVICTTDNSPEFERRGNGIDLEEAIYTALLDPHKLNLIDRFNILRDGTVDDDLIKSKQVLGARLISGVIFVQLKSQSGVLEFNPNKVAESHLFINEHADVLINRSQHLLLSNMNFNRFEYGPGWESWEGTHRDPIIARNRKKGGSFTMGSGKDGVYYIELPAITIIRIMAGDISAEEALSTYGDNPKLIDWFDKVLNESHSIENISFVKSDLLSREEDRIRIEFSDPESPVIARSKKNQ